ncbi:MAG: hypothetical protein L0Y72_11190 [Gemmataceae bacterium]|nr:hypothetical protein [Gemmataceae bacterium]MCI0739601.1 hypothetical protein [Gemmataceae bacterium]
MWFFTPKRIVILLGGLALFLTSYAVYAFFLGGIDGLPLLPGDYLPGDGPGDVPDISDVPDGHSEKKWKYAYGAESEELRRPLRLDLNSKGVLIAANTFEIDKNDGRVLLYPCSVALFPKSRQDSKFPEINTIQCEMALLTLDRPVTSPTELNNRKIMAVELRGSRGIVMVNNRRTPEKTDDIEVRISGGPMFYDERRNLIWTDGYVQLLDSQTQPDPTKITAKGMEIKMAENTGPNKKRSPKPKTTDPQTGEALSGVEMLKLKSHVDMHLFVDARSGFLAGGDFGKKSDKPAAADKSHVVIKTNGSFHYDLTKELAWFDSPPPQEAALASPEQVLVSRQHKAGDAILFDQLLCDHLKLQFRRKTPIDKREGRSTDKDIETAWATNRSGKEVVLTMDSDELEAYGEELIYHSATADSGPRTLLKGKPLHAIQKGHKIEARELYLFGADKDGKGQKAVAQGPGQIDIFDKSNPKKTHPMHALWKETLTLVRDKEGNRWLDVLTMSGDATWVDEEHQQELQGQRLQIWLETPGKDAKATFRDGVQVGRSTRQKPTKIEAFDKVFAKSPELIVRDTHQLVIRFTNEPGLDERLPDMGPVNSKPPLGDKAPAAAPALAPPAAVPQAGVKDKNLLLPTRSRKPIELQANVVQAQVSAQGAKKELRDVVCEGNVHVHQEGENAEDKGIDINGDLLHLTRHANGDKLTVISQSPKMSQLQLGELLLFGPKVTIDQRVNIAEVDGQGAMELPSDTTFDGGKVTKKNTRLTIHWNKDMIFNGKYADFHGGVEAFQDDSKMKCDALQVTLNRLVSFKDGQRGKQKAAVEKLVCDKKVFLQDIASDSQGKPVKYHHLIASELSVDNQDGPIIANGPRGEVRYWGLGGGDNSLLSPPSGKSPAKSVPENRQTRVNFDGRMFSNNKDSTRVAKFMDNVEVRHFPTDDPQANMNVNRLKKNEFYLRCGQLTVYTRQADGKSTQFMLAERAVRFDAEEFFGQCEMLKYDESHEQVIFEGNAANPAVLYKRVQPGVQPPEIRGTKILYNRKTGVFQLEGGKLIQWSQCSPQVPLGGTASLFARLDANCQNQPLLVLGFIARDDG